VEIAVETFDCLVLDLEGFADVFALTQRALGSSAKVGRLAVDDFSNSASKKNPKSDWSYFRSTGRQT